MKQGEPEPRKAMMLEHEDRFCSKLTYIENFIVDATEPEKAIL